MANPSKAKGRRFEHEVAAAVGGERRIMSGIDGKGDVEIVDVRRGPFRDFVVEAKCRKTLAVDTWFAQAKRAAQRFGEGYIPMLVVKRDKGKLLAVMDLADLKLLLNSQEPL